MILAVLIFLYGLPAIACCILLSLSGNFHITNFLLFYDKYFEVLPFGYSLLPIGIFFCCCQNNILVLFLTIGGNQGMKGSPASSKGESMNGSPFDG
jgi:hypothetical protein